MKSHRFLIGLVGVTAIGTFAVYATGQQTAPLSSVTLYQPPGLMAPAAPACQAPQAYSYAYRQPPSELRKTLDANPNLVPMLMEMQAKGDEWERKAAERTLEAVCKTAVPEFIKALNDPDLANRKAAIGLLAYSAINDTNLNYPLNDVISALMKIARDENEPEELRKIAKITLCQILQFSQGDYSSMRNEGASPASGD